jgi:hypothetical protein
VGERGSLHARFAARFAADGLDGPARPCDTAALDQIEAALDTLLPVAYREFLAACGPLFVPVLWDAVVRRELGAEPVREFFSPADVDRDTRLYWSGGMPSDFIGVASDGCGNMFGFRRLPRCGPRPDDSPVLFFDHDFVRVVEASGSFDGWLGWFLASVPDAEPSAAADGGGM